MTIANTTVQQDAVRYKTLRVQELDIFYREAGDPDKPAILLLHGYPSSSYMFRDLLNDLQNDYCLVAPDYPGFGYSSMPAREEYNYTFDQLSVTIEAFIEALGLTRFALYIQDYGSPVGFRIATRHPEWITALLVQNGNAYEEGLGPAVDDGKRFWANRNEGTEQVVRGMLTPEGTKFQYLSGTRHPELISPDTYTRDQHLLDRPGNADIQIDLLYDYRNNLTLYPVWQAYLRQHQPPVLITWGANDQLFTAAGAKAYLKDVPDAELHLLDTGHFALEECHGEIAGYIRAFLKDRG